MLSLIPASLVDDNLHVLENHHVDTSLSLLRGSLLAGLDSKQQEHVQTRLRACILATDMAMHGELITNVVSPALDPCPDCFSLIAQPLEQRQLGPVTQAILDKDDKVVLTMMQALLHTADLYNPVKPFAVSQRWAARLQQEFNRQVCNPRTSPRDDDPIGLIPSLQVDLETEQDLPVLPHMTGRGPLALAQGEVGFVRHAAKPWYEAVCTAFPALSPMLIILSKWRGQSPVSCIGIACSRWL